MQRENVLREEHKFSLLFDSLLLPDSNVKLARSHVGASLLLETAYGSDLN
jgi:hypothetical protein